MSETVLVTGGSGFVAGWCVVELLRRGYAVRATVRNLSKGPAVQAAIQAVVPIYERLSFAPADLTSDEGWDAAMSGCGYVLHVASPLGDTNSREPNALIAPARDGTLRVLRAASKAGVRRVVVTSSAGAATPAQQQGEYHSDESTWTDASDPKLDAYRKSKVLAERAAWEFVRDNATSMELVTILPTAIFGPVLSTEKLGSVQLIQRLLQGRPPGILKAGFCVVDVRDLADLHVRAMTAPEAAGQRFLAAGEFLWMKDVANILRSNLGERARNVPRRELPNVLVQAASWFVPAFRHLTPLLGRKLLFRSEKAKCVLGFSPRPAAETIVDCAESLLNGNRSN